MEKHTCIYVVGWLLKDLYFGKPHPMRNYALRGYCYPKAARYCRSAFTFPPPVTQYAHWEKHRGPYV